MEVMRAHVHHTKTLLLPGPTDPGLRMLLYFMLEVLFVYSYLELGHVIKVCMILLTDHRIGTFIIMYLNMTWG